MPAGSFDRVARTFRSLAWNRAYPSYVSVSVTHCARSFPNPPRISLYQPPHHSPSLFLFVSHRAACLPLSLSHPQTPASLSLARAPKTQERERNSLAWYTAINPCIYPSILWWNRHLVRLGFIAGSSAGYLPAFFLSPSASSRSFLSLPLTTDDLISARTLRDSRLLYESDRFYRKSIQVITNFWRKENKFEGIYVFVISLHICFYFFYIFRKKANSCFFLNTT